MGTKMFSTIFTWGVILMLPCGREKITGDCIAYCKEQSKECEKQLFTSEQMFETMIETRRERQNNQFGNQFVDKKPEVLRWRTIKGEQVAVSDMDTEHIINCLCLLKKKGWNKLKALVNDEQHVIWYIDAFYAELDRRDFDDWYLFSEEVS